MALSWVDATPSSEAAQEGMNKVELQLSGAQRNTGWEIVSTNPINEHKSLMERRKTELLHIEITAQNDEEIRDIEVRQSEEKEEGGEEEGGGGREDTVHHNSSEALNRTMDTHSDRGYDSDQEEKSMIGEEKMITETHIHQRDIDFREIDVGGVFCLDEDVDWMLEQENQSIQQREDDDEDDEDRMEAPSTREIPFSNYEELIPTGRHRRSGNQKVHPSELSTVWSRIRSESSRNGSPPITIPGCEGSDAMNLPQPTIFDYGSEKIGMIERQNQERARDLMYHLVLRLHPFAFNGSREESNFDSFNESPHFC
ncbi:unnamed protein product, partial [Mesorhabditis belari]|uniref:Uncharacterized protein n=1 Tax=Mesorhabditis belari TaxID=2138241 RepID=A0AAF3J4J5_9BILA